MRRADSAAAAATAATKKCNAVEQTARATPSSTAKTTRSHTNSSRMHLSFGLLPIMLLLLLFFMQQQTSDCRYLPTRSHGDDLDKLRELMLQILESSNEEPQQLQQPPRPPNDANGNTIAQRANWWNKLNAVAAAADGAAYEGVGRKAYGSVRGSGGGLYDANGRYYF